MKNEKYSINRSNLNEPYPMNLLLAINETPLENKPLDLNNVTQDTIDGLNHALGTLPERLREIVRLRFEEKQTYSKIGTAIGVTPERIRYLVYDAARRLRQPPVLFYICYGKQGYEKIRLQIAEEKKKKVPSVMDIPIKDLDLSVRAENRLIATGCKSVADIVALKGEEIVTIKNLGKTSLQEIARKLETLGITDSEWSDFI